MNKKLVVICPLCKKEFWGLDGGIINDLTIHLVFRHQKEFKSALNLAKRAVAESLPKTIGKAIRVK